MYPQKNNTQSRSVDETGKPRLLYVAISLLLVVFVTIIVKVILLDNPLANIYASSHPQSSLGWVEVLVLQPIVGLAMYALASKYVLKQTALATLVSIICFLGLYTIISYLLAFIVYPLIDAIPIEEYSNTNTIVLYVFYMIYYFVITLPIYIISTNLGYKIFPPKNN